MQACTVEGCTKAVSKAGFQLCFDHWKADRSGRLGKCERCQRYHENDAPHCNACAPKVGSTSTEDDSPAGFLSSTKIGKHFGVSNIKLNLILAELGWIERYVKGWVPTDRGNALGANIREARNGVPFVVWPDSILQNHALKDSIRE